MDAHQFWKLNIEFAESMNNSVSGQGLFQQTELLIPSKKQYNCLIDKEHIFVMLC